LSGTIGVRGKSRLATLLLALLIGAAMPRGVAAQEAIAVIVNRGNPLEGVNADDLRRLYLGTTTVFPNKERVVLFEEADLRESFYRTVAKMNGDRVKRHWIGVVFTGSSAIPPKTLAEGMELRELVSRQRGAIGFVDPRAVDESVKVISVDGFRPGDPGYPIRVIALP
jgi:ABC-type phosphate transport system substrate-binding protein